MLGSDRPPWRERLVLLKQPWARMKISFCNDCGNRDFNPVGTRALVVKGHA